MEALYLLSYSGVFLISFVSYYLFLTMPRNSLAGYLLSYSGIIVFLLF
ncbi:MAG: hypothetical protein Q8O99_03565 [bacterium]|nr:hypothetical protein [bacterium]